jgi:hypothetical protein
MTNTSASIKLHHIKTLTVAELMAYEGSNRELVNLKRELAETNNNLAAGGWPPVEEYITYELLHYAECDSVEVVQCETLSLNDGHVECGDNDLGYFYSEMERLMVPLGIFTRVSQGVVSILYFS